MRPVTGNRLQLVGRQIAIGHGVLIQHAQKPFGPLALPQQIPNQRHRHIAGQNIAGRCHRLPHAGIVNGTFDQQRVFQSAHLDGQRFRLLNRERETSAAQLVAERTSRIAQGGHQRRIAQRSLNAGNRLFLSALNAVHLFTQHGPALQKIAELVQRRWKPQRTHIRQPGSKALPHGLLLQPLENTRRLRRAHQHPSSAVIELLKEIEIGDGFGRLLAGQLIFRRAESAHRHQFLRRAGIRINRGELMQNFIGRLSHR